MLTRYYENIPFFTRGADLTIDKRLCFQSHDNYFGCLDTQNIESKLNIIKK